MQSPYTFHQLNEASRDTLSFPSIEVHLEPLFPPLVKTLIDTFIPNSNAKCILLIAACLDPSWPQSNASCINVYLYFSNVICYISQIQPIHIPAVLTLMNPILIPTYMSLMQPIYIPAVLTVMNPVLIPACVRLMQPA